MNVTIKNLKGEQFKVQVSLDESVQTLKQKIEALKPDHAADRLKLIFAGRVLKDSSTLSDEHIGENDFIVCMLTKEVSKPKPAPIPTTINNNINNNNVNNNVNMTPTVSGTSVNVPQAPVAAPGQTLVTPTSALLSNNSMSPNTSAINNINSNNNVNNNNVVVNAEVVANLVAMGFPESECRAALSAAGGNADLAVDFLMSGIPPNLPLNNNMTATTTNRIVNNNIGVNSLDSFRSHPQFNQLKQLVQQNPAKINEVMDSIGKQNPALLETIHANHDAFVAMMNEPITNTPPPPLPSNTTIPTNNILPNPAQGMGINPAQIMQMMSMLPPEQRGQMAQQMGMTVEQLNGMMQVMSTMTPEQLQSMGLGGNDHTHGGGAAGNVVRLTEEEMASVNRLMELGFSQQEAAQAFLACDRNEALAANLLLEGGWQDGGMDEDMGDYGGDEY